jgi:hypothetical protein
VLRLAGTLELMQWAWHGGTIPATVAVRQVEAAAELRTGYFWPHAVAAIRQVGVSDRHAEARRVLRWLKATGKAEVSREEVRREALGKRLDADQAQAVIDELVRAGWLRERVIPTTGRHARRWEASPCLLTS